MFRSFKTPTIWREMDHLQREMNRLFNDYSRYGLRKASGYPAINIWVNDDCQLVSAEMPGVRSEDIDLSVEGDLLTIRGELGGEEIPEGAQCHRKERGSGTFSRTIQLPYTVDPDKVEAGFKDGILSITLPPVEDEKPKKIAITQ